MHTKDFSPTVTAVAAALRTEPCFRATVTARKTNAGKVFVGDSNSQSTALSPGDSVDMFVGDTNKIFIRGTAGDRLEVLAFIT